MATVSLETVLARLDALQGQLVVMHMRQTELENQIRSVGRLWSLMQDYEDLIRPDAAVVSENEGRRDEGNDDLDLVG